MDTDSKNIINLDLKREGKNLNFNDYPIVIRKWINIGVTCCVNIETKDFEYDSLQSLYNSFK